MINQTALAFWTLGAAIGYLVNDAHGLAAGLVITCGITFLIDMFASRR